MFDGIPKNFSQQLAWLKCPILTQWTPSDHPEVVAVASGNVINHHKCGNGKIMPLTDGGNGWIAERPLLIKRETHRGSKRSGSDPEGSDRMLPRAVSAMWHDSNSNNTKKCIFFPGFCHQPWCDGRPHKQRLWCYSCYNVIDVYIVTLILNTLANLRKYCHVLGFAHANSGKGFFSIFFIPTSGYTVMKFTWAIEAYVQQWTSYG